MAELLHFVEKLNMAVATILDLLKRKSDDASVSEMPFSEPPTKSICGPEVAQQIWC